MPAPAQATVVESDRLYPNLEEYLETHDRAETEALFADTKEQLEHLSKGAKARAAKKALQGITEVEKLFAYLFDVKEQLEAKAVAAKKTSRK